MPVEFYYSAVNDMTYVDAEPEDYKRLRSYADSRMSYHLGWGLWLRTFVSRSASCLSAGRVPLMFQDSSNSLSVWETCGVSVWPGASPEGLRHVSRLLVGRFVISASGFMELRRLFSTFSACLATAGLGLLPSLRLSLCRVVWPRRSLRLWPVRVSAWLGGAPPLRRV